MKKIVFVTLFSVGLVYAYNVFATSNLARMDNGCDSSNTYECEVWYVTPEGKGMILEKGKNIAYIDPNPGDTSQP